MIALNVEQGSHEWLAARAGKITASMFRTARETKKNGEYTTAAKDYAMSVAVEIVSGEPLDGGFNSWQMRRGTEMEPEARAAHAFTTGKEITETGIVISDCERFGGSADGLIGDDGLAEYKCLIGASSLREFFIERDHQKYVDQCQGLMWITGRQYCELVVYCPLLASIGRDVEIIRIERDEDYIKQLRIDLVKFRGLVDQYVAELAGDALEMVGA